MTPRTQSASRRRPLVIAGRTATPRDRSTKDPRTKPRARLPRELRHRLHDRSESTTRKPGTGSRGRIAQRSADECLWVNESPVAFGSVIPTDLVLLKRREVGALCRRVAPAIRVAADKLAEEIPEGVLDHHTERDPFGALAGFRRR